MQSTKKYCGCFIVALCLTLAIASFSFMVHTMGRTTTVFAPPQFDESAAQGNPREAAELPADWSVLDDVEMPFSVGISGLPQKTDDNALKVWFYNPEDNGSWLQLQILDADGQVLGSSGLLKPGSYVENISGSFEGMAKSSEVSMKVLGYEPNLYYSQGSFILRSQISL